MKKFKTLTKKDSDNLCSASTDILTGGYLLSDRSYETRKAINEIFVAINANDPDQRQKDVVEWFKVCTDYYYAKENGYIDDEGNIVEIKWKDSPIKNRVTQLKV